MSKHQLVNFSPDLPCYLLSEIFKIDAFRVNLKTWNLGGSQIVPWFFFLIPHTKLLQFPNFQPFSSSLTFGRGFKLEIFWHLAQKCPKLSFGIFPENIILSSKINLNLITRDVFKFRNEYHSNRTLFWDFITFSEVLVLKIEIFYQMKS